MRKSAFVLTALLLAGAGCEPSEPVYQGYVMEDFFPFDGNRTWEYISTDVDLSYKLVATLNTSSEPANEDQSDIYTVDLASECIGMDPECEDGTVTMSYRMSSDQGWGTLYWGYSDPEAGSFEFTPPIEFTDRTMKVGDVSTTEVMHHGVGADPMTGTAMTFTSTLEAVEACPIDWHDNWEQCVRLRVEEASHAYPAGTYWAVNSYNIVAWTPAPEEESHQWRLIYANWESMEE